MLSTILVSVAGAAVAQDKAKEPQGGMRQGDMEAMMKSMAPGEQQKQLARMAGDTFTNEMFGYDPTGKEKEMKWMEITAKRAKK